jgi:hypothetical protein
MCLYFLQVQLKRRLKNTAVGFSLRPRPQTLKPKTWNLDLNLLPVHRSPLNPSLISSSRVTRPLAFWR